MTLSSCGSLRMTQQVGRGEDGGLKGSWAMGRLGCVEAGSWGGWDRVQGDESKANSGAPHQTACESGACHAIGNCRLAPDHMI